MSEEVEVSDQKEVDISKKIEKEEMVSFLTSSGKIKEEFAGSLYDQGLDNWKTLTEGTEDYFTGLNKVGPARAKVLLDIASLKKEELGAPSKPGLKEVLETVPRMSQRIISNLLESGYDSIESFKGKIEEDLEQIKGIGPKMSGAIVKAISDHIEKYGAEDAEEATAEVMEVEKEEGAKDERSLIQRIIDTIGGLLGGKKKEEVEEPEEEKEPEQAPEEKTEEPVEEKEEPSEEEIVEEPSEEEPLEEEPVPEEEEVEEPSEETAEEKEEPPEEAPKEEMGFFDKLKAMLFGGSKKEETSDEEKKEEEKEEAATEEETASEEKEEPSEKEETQESEEKPEKNIEDFEDIPGVSKKTAEMLRGAGYLNIDELKEAVPEDLAMVDGIGPKTAEKICNALKN